MTVRIMTGDCRDVLRSLPSESVHCCKVLAYCAGVIDSDGTIGVRRLTYGMRKLGTSKQPTYTARICVRQVEPQAVNLLAETFGGPVLQARTYAKRGKMLLQWEAKDAAAQRVLIAILPYLRIKRAQAENALVLRGLVAESKKARIAFGRGHVGSAPRPTHITEAMEQAYLRAKELNAVGVGERRPPCL
jgi:hypothetical protein